MFDSLIPDALIHLDSGFQSNISGFQITFDAWMPDSSSWTPKFDSSIPDALIRVDFGFQSKLSGFRVTLMYRFHTF